MKFILPVLIVITSVKCVASTLVFTPISVSLESSAFRTGTGGSEGSNSNTANSLPATVGSNVTNNITANGHVNAWGNTSATWGVGDTMSVSSDILTINYGFNSNTHAGATANSTFIGSYTYSGLDGTVQLQFDATALSRSGAVDGLQPDTVSTGVILTRDRGGSLSTLLDNTTMLPGSSLTSMEFDALDGDVFFLELQSLANTVLGPGASGINDTENGNFSATASLEVTSIPEPSSYLLIGMAFIGLSCRRSRRN